MFYYLEKPYNPYCNGTFYHKVSVTLIPANLVTKSISGVSLVSRLINILVPIVITLFVLAGTLYCCRRRKICCWLNKTPTPKVFTNNDPVNLESTLT